MPDCICPDLGATGANQRHSLCQSHKQPYIVEYTVKGARTIREKHCGSLDEAQRVAERWRRSNSTGDYIAHIYDPEGNRY